MERIVNFFKKMSNGQKIYSLLWSITGIILIILISFLGYFAGTTNENEMNLVASFGFIFVLILIFSIFFTVFVQYKNGQSKLKKERKNE